MSRSCQSATFSSAGTTWLRTSRARPHRFSLIHGLRLCGIAELPFWPRRERLGGLADLAALQMPDLGREALDAARDQRERGEERGVAVARDHLGRDRLRRAARAAPRPRPRPPDRSLAKVPTAPEIAQVAISARAVSQPAPVARELGVEAGELEAEGGGLGVHAVRAADAGRVLVLEGAAAQRGEQLVEIGEQAVGGLGQLAGEGGVEQVRGGHAEVQVARLGADHLLEVGQERDHVVARGGLDRLDPRGIDDRLDPRARPRCARPPPRPLRHLAEPGHRLAAPRARPRARAAAGSPAPRWPPSRAGVASDHRRACLAAGSAHLVAAPPGPR